MHYRSLPARHDSLMLLSPLTHPKRVGSAGSESIGSIRCCNLVPSLKDVLHMIGSSANCLNLAGPRIDLVRTSHSPLLTYLHVATLAISVLLKGEQSELVPSARFYATVGVGEWFGRWGSAKALVAILRSMPYTLSHLVYGLCISNSLSSVFCISCVDTLGMQRSVAIGPFFEHGHTNRPYGCQSWK